MKKNKRTFPWLKIFIFGIILIISIPLGVYLSVILTPSTLPSDEGLHKIYNMEASEVYSYDGELMGKYFIQDRKTLEWKQISKHAIDALLATEDTRFYIHKGIDWQSIPRVAFKTILLRDRSSGGGSTITQQLAKNLYPRIDFKHLSLLKNKIREMIIALRIEKIYTKKEILTLYLNTVPFGENVFGIEAASHRFFNKPADELYFQEAALLIGMLKATSWYNPKNHQDRARVRRNVVLNQMVKAEVINKVKADSLKNLPVQLDYHRMNQNEGLAPYLREQVRQRVADLLPKISDSLNINLNLYTDGLKIITSIDMQIQRYAEQSVQEKMALLQDQFDKHWSGKKKPWESNARLIRQLLMHSSQYIHQTEPGFSEDSIMQELQKPQKMEVFSWKGPQTLKLNTIDSIKYYLKFLNTGFVAISPSTGRIVAWVGGINYEYFKYDHVSLHTKRQVGSTFKPIVYAAALEAGISPCEYIKAEQTTFNENGEEWTPSNAGKEYEGKYSLEGALTESVNTVSVKILEEVGIDNTIALARLMGISSTIPKVPSIALGTPSISLLEMTSAYCVFANNGKTVKPWYIDRIEDSNGNLLWKNKRSEHKKALSNETAQMMIQMLKNVVDNGTGRSLRYTYNLHNDMAGKTGTTQNNVDGWFIGITPHLVAGAWVGGEYPEVHFRTTALGQGAKTALPVFGAFMQKLNNDPKQKNITHSHFPTPSAYVLKELDCDPFKEELSFFEWLFGKKKKDKNVVNQRTADKPKKEKKGFIKSLKNIFKKKKN